MSLINKKQAPTLLVIAIVLVILFPLAVLHLKKEEAQYETPQYEGPQAYEELQYEGMYKHSLARDYKSLLGHFSEANPGRGVLDYPGNESADYAKSYAMFLSAELLQAQRAPEFQLSEMGKNAGNWLLDNADIDGDGVVGWGLPVEWDAYGDGTINPPNTIYTITTSVAINGLLDWLEMDPRAPADRIIATVDAAFEPFLKPETISPNGLLPYSLSSNDQRYDTYNPAAYMAGQMQRFSEIIQNSDRRKQLHLVSDTVMVSLLENKQLDKNKGWYWYYSLDEEVPNDATHAIYIAEGIYQYIQHKGSIANQFDWVAINRHITLFYSQEDRQFKQFPQVENTSYSGPPRLYEVGMLMYYMGRHGIKEAGDTLYVFSLKYRLPDGLYTKFPLGEDSSEENLVINEYMSYLLYGYSSLLNAPVVGEVSPVQNDWHITLRQNGLPAADINNDMVVPFTYFDVKDYDIELEFNVNLLKGNLIVNEMTIALPAGTLPLKIIQWNKESLIVFTRKLWSNQTQVWILDVSLKRFYPIPVPDDLDEHMFRHAVLYNRHIVFVLFDPIAKTNYIYRLLPTNNSNGLQLNFDESFKQEYYINEQFGYRQQPKILMTEYRERLFIASDSVIYEYGYLPDTDHSFSYSDFEIPNNYKLLELASDNNGVFALYKDVNYSIEKAVTSQNAPFILYDLLNQKIIFDDYQGHIPYNLHVVDGEAIVEIVESQQDIVNLFLFDLQSMPGSGLMSAGVNNYEGEVIWTQSYYLNALIDVLNSNESFLTVAPFNSIKPQLKLRLDFEMALIDKMMLEGPGLLCKTFTVDRAPVLHAVQTGKFLLLLKRYLSLPNAIEMKSYESFRLGVMNLDRHVEVLTQATSDDPWLNDDRYYLMWPMGSSFWADGVGIPYNHQNMWAAGVIFAEDMDNLPSDNLKQITYDISSQVLDLEGFRSFIPKHSQWFANSVEYHHWHYWWGQAKVGWSEADDISINTPVWHGDGDNIALPVYRTFDAITILIAGRQFDNFLPVGFVEYINDGVEKGELELFLIPYLERYGKTPDINQELISKTLRMSSQPDMRNAVWAYYYLSRSIRSPALSVNLNAESEFESVSVYILDVLLVMLFAFLLIAVLRVDRLVTWLIGIYLVVYAVSVLTVEVSSLFSLLNSKLFFLFFHWMLLLAITLIWLLRGSPTPFSPFWKLNVNLEFYLSSIRLHWDVWVAGLFCAIGFLFIGYSNLVLPQSIDDVLTAHLARVGYWLQFGKLTPWQADTYQMSQIIYPLNAQAQIYWSLLFLRTDQLVGFSQWIALPVMMLNIYGICRMMRIERKWAVIASLTIFSIPSIYLQTFTAMTDLVSAVLFVSMFYLLFLGLETGRTETLGFSALALGLSLGTKQTIIFAIPGLIIVCLYILIMKRKAVWGYLLKWTGIFFVAFVTTGSYIYIFNYYWWGNPLGPPVAFQGFTNREATLSIFDYVMKFLLNIKSLFVAILQVDLFSWNYANVNPSPGPMFGVIIIFSMLYLIFLIRNKSNNLIAFSLFIVAVFYGLILLVVREYTTALLRYLIISYALLIPLAISGFLKFSETYLETQE